MVLAEILGSKFWTDLRAHLLVAYVYQRDLA